MSSIDAVIARARTSGGYSERKRFSIARDRAIEKMRKFALADPFFYILELVQAAVANEAGYIDIAIDGGDVTLAYIGGGLREQDLTDLFDYLFASKDRAEVGHLRELALGLNAALLFKPDRVVVESGDGALAHTTRMEMHDSHDAVDIGKPDKPLAGTYIRIEGMKRKDLPSAFSRMLFGDRRPREFEVIESRCLAAPVPLILNGQPLFGFSAQRTPALLGAHKVVTFDEGDLYGALGLRDRDDPGDFDLLMWGVLVQSKPHALIPGRHVFGKLCFDRLRKTADHSGIVDDDRMAEMWARLLPYAEQLVHGRADVGISAVTHPDGRTIDTATVRELARNNASLVLIDGEPPRTARRIANALAIGEQLGAPVLFGHERFVPALRAMSGGTLSVVTPDPEDTGDLAFFSQAPHAPPARPWLTAVVEADPLPSWKLGARLMGAAPGHEEALRPRLGELLGHLGRNVTLHSTVFTPESRQAADALRVEIVSSERLLWAGTIPSSFSGHVLRIDLPEATPGSLVGAMDHGGASLLERVADVMVSHSGPALALAFGRAVSSLADRAVEPGTAAARLALQAATRTCVPRLASSTEGPCLVLEHISGADSDLRTLPVVRTLAGEALSLQDLVGRINRCEGFLYGTLVGVEADVTGLDLTAVLALDRASERSLNALFGEGCFVRVDGRDVLARHGTHVCRDLALGLRSYGEGPLLVEPSSPLEPGAEAALVRRLIGVFLGVAEAEKATGVAEDREECRRHAARSLQWYVCEVLRRGLEAPVPEVFELPLFLDTDGHAHSIHAVVAALRSDRSLPMVYGRALGAAELGTLVAAATQPDDAAALPRALAVSLFLHRRLAWLSAVRPAFDFSMVDASAAEGAVDTLWIVTREVALPGVRGVLGIPEGGVRNPDIAVLRAGDERTRGFTDIAIEFGIVGWVQLDRSATWNAERTGQFQQALRETAEACLEDLLALMVSDKKHPQGVPLLLEFARRQILFTAAPGQQPVPTVSSGLVDRILGLSIFAGRHGASMGGWRLIRRYCALVEEDGSTADRRVLDELAEDLDPYLKQWVRKTLTASNIVRSPGKKRAAAPTVGDELTTIDLQQILAHWLAALRPDPLAEPVRVWVHDSPLDGLAVMNGADLFVNPEHPLVTTAQFNPSGRAFAWLLLGVYAAVNAQLDEVSNRDERRFQQALSKAFRDGALYPA